METSGQLINLKFDIYERVLTEDKSINKVLGSNLIPFLKTSVKEDAILVEGYLLFVVCYGEPVNLLDFQYRIPVEISIPKSRVVAPENLEFATHGLNVELLSPYSMNVTGNLIVREEDKAPLVPQEVSNAMVKYLSLFATPKHPNHVILTDWSFIADRDDQAYSVLFNHFLSHPVEYVKAAMLK